MIRTDHNPLTALSTCLWLAALCLCACAEAPTATNAGDDATQPPGTGTAPGAVTAQAPASGMPSAPGVGAAGSGSDMGDAAQQPEATGNDAPPVEETAVPGAMPPDGPLAAWPTISIEQGYGFDEGEVTIMPGHEGYLCVRARIPEPWASMDTALHAWDVDLPEGTHHFFMNFVPMPFPGTASEDITTCAPGGDYWIDVTNDPNGGSVTQFLQGGGKILLGEGVGTRHWSNGEDPVQHGSYLPAGGHLVTNHHVVNLGTEPITVSGRFNLYVKPTSEVPYVTQMVNCLANNINIPPGAEQTVSGICTAPFPMDIVVAASHGHQHMLRFELRKWNGAAGVIEDELLYESTDWDSPNIIPQNPAIHLKAGDGLAFRCDFYNYSDRAVTYQFAGEDSEMCAFMGAYAFPATPANVGKVPPHLGAILGNEFPGLMLDTAIVPGPF